jgi:hypothetical protein
MHDLLDERFPDPTDLVLDEPFFAPTTSDLFDNLLAQYQVARNRIDQVAALFKGELGGVIHYFLEAYRSSDRHASSISTEKLFQRDGAIAALNSTFWNKALALTDVRELMPQARRNEWDTMLRENKAPEFNEETVRPTILELLNSRQRFVAERIDGIFRGLSGTHVTNAPEAFGRRMIISGVLNEYGHVQHSMSGLIHDLRCVIAKFMGRGDPRQDGTDLAVQTARARRGEWQDVDGGALRMRVYKIGTAHLEVHPDMAWRLNAMLASLYPLAIPPEFRRRPARASRKHAPMLRPLPHRVLEILASARPSREKVCDWPERWSTVRHAVDLRWYDVDKTALAEAESILERMGGVNAKLGRFQFDYDALDAIHQVVVTGCIPDRQSHQFYPTPLALANRAVALALIGPGQSVLEPSAGQGAIAGLLPPERTCCVEISALHCDILKARGLTDVVAADFIATAQAWVATPRRFDRCVMNPPFSDGRAQLHVEHAASLLAAGGRLVAILPSGLQGKDVLGAAFEHEWHGPFDNEFEGTGVSVTMLVATRRQT